MTAPHTMTGSAEARAKAGEGMAALQRGDGQGAEQAFLQAIEMGWPGPDVWVALSQARRLTGDRAGRADALDRALAIAPGDLRARLYRAELSLEMGDMLGAQAMCREALAQAANAPQTGEMQGLIGWAQQMVKAGDAREALLSAFADDDLGRTPDDPLFRQSLDLLTGAARVYHPQPTRYLYPGLPTRQFYPRDAFAWTEDVERRTAEIREELRALEGAAPDAFAPYVEGTGREGELDHSLKDNPDWSAFYLVKQGERIEANIARCPATMAAMETVGEDGFPAPAPSILFSQLKPGTRIPPHHGMLNTRLVCHLPLIVPERCGFRVGNETRRWREGELFLFDDTIEHEAWNDSDAPRFVLIFELWRPELDARQRRLVTKLFDRVGGAR